MFRLDVAPGVTFMEGERRGRFPFGNMLVLSAPSPDGTGRRRAAASGAGRILVDTGGGDEALEAVVEGGPVDLVINTHYHIDHVRGNQRFAGAGIDFWCPQGEAAAIATWEGFLEFTGFGRPGFEEARLFRSALGWTPTPIARELVDGETLDFGGAGAPEAVVVRLPGHTPGHTGLWLPSRRIVFSADIDLSGFGPWYGDVYGSIDDYLNSLQRLDVLVDEASSHGRRSVTILTSHRRPLTYGEFKARLPRFVAHVAERDERILGILAERGPLTIEQVAAAWPIYGSEVALLPGVRKSEYFMVKHHLERLARAGRVVTGEGESRSESQASAFGGRILWRVP